VRRKKKSRGAGEMGEMREMREMREMGAGQQERGVLNFEFALLTNVKLT
jgi:hypothetical protein